MRKLTTEEMKQRSLARQQAGEHALRLPIYGLLDNIRSLWNVGSIFRTADAVLARKLFLTGMTGRPPRREIAKTALGAEAVVPWEYVTDPCKAVCLLKEMGVTVVALEHTVASEPIDGFSFPFPICLVVGHEVEGVSSDVLAQVDGAVEIPMHGTKESLNVSVAFGVAAYAVAGQWHDRNRS